jgi:TolB-like protein/Tfp pilus assembly protein PilF
MGGKDVDRPAASAREADLRGPPPGEAVQAALDGVLRSKAFRLSERGRRFLRFVVEETLAGRDERIKAYTIATQVFGRGDDFDATNDPIVRIEAGRLRRALELYYLSSGAEDEVRIELNKGSYVPSFGWMPSAPSAARAGARGASSLPWSMPRVSGRAARVLGVSLAVAAAGAGLVLTRMSGEPLHAPSMSRPDEVFHGPIVQVRPLEVLSRDDDDVLLSQSLGSELVRNLSQFADLQIFENAASVPGVPVTFTIDGDLAREDERIRVNIRLVNATTGQILWSQSYTRTLSVGSVIDLEAEITAEIASQVAQPNGPLSRVTVAMFRNTAPASMATYLCMQRAYELRRSFSAQAYPEIRQCLGEAVEREPDYPDAWAMLAFVQLEGWQLGLADPDRRQQEFDASLLSANRAYDLAPQNMLALQALAAVLFFRGQHESSEELLRSAIKLNPYLPDIHAQLGWRLVMLGRRDAGMEEMRIARERSVTAPRWYNLITSLDAFLLGDYDTAAEAAQATQGTCCGLGHLLLALAEAGRGNVELARQEFAAAVAQEPSLADDPLALFKIHQANTHILDAVAVTLMKIGIDVAERAPPENPR